MSKLGAFEFLEPRSKRSHGCFLRGPFENTPRLFFQQKSFITIFKPIFNGVIISYLKYLNEETRLKMFFKHFKASLLKLNRQTGRTFTKKVLETINCTTLHHRYI